MKQRVFFIFIVIVILTLFIWNFTSYNSRLNDVKNTTNSFVKNIVEGDIEKAKDISTGLVRYNLENHFNNDNTKKVENIEIHVIELLKDWSTTKVSLQTDESMFWYDIYLIKEDVWKVYNITYSDPILDKSFAIRNNGVKQAEEVFIDFCKNTLEGNYEKASFYLAGKAKNKYEEYKQILKMIVNNTDFNLKEKEVVHNSKNTVIMKFKFNIGDREVKNLVHFYKVGNEYKIYSISQI